MTDLNTAIAHIKGYCEKFGLMDKASLRPHKYWVCPDGQLTTVLPDYEHDANLYMALFEEICNAPSVDSVLFIPDGKGGGNLSFQDCNEMDIINADGNSFGEAVCLNFCKLKGIEVVG